MKRAAITLIALLSVAGTAAAQSAGQDGMNLYASNGAWQCNKVRFPAGASAATVLITGTKTVCANGSCSDAGGDADLYVYTTTAGSSTKPGSRQSGYACRPYLTGDNESCPVSASGSVDTYYWACADSYANYNQIQLRGEYNLGTSGSSSSGSGALQSYWIDFWKNNLFLGIAYHRFGCFTNNVTIVDDREFDGFTDTDYCRPGYGLSDPANRGGDSTYMTSFRWDNVTWQQVKNTLEACGTSTNNAYVTPNYQRRSNSCSYNIMTNCNSDCWIKKFSTCLLQPIDTLSPCW